MKESNRTKSKESRGEKNEIKAETYELQMKAVELPILLKAASLKRSVK